MTALIKLLKSKKNIRKLRYDNNCNNTTAEFYCFIKNKH